MLLYKILPYPIFKKLWGDRHQFGFTPKPDDPEWKIWRQYAFGDFYQKTQTKGIGDKVGRLSHSVLEQIDFNAKEVIEVGPGIIRHLKYLNKNISCYTICDLNQEILDFAGKQLSDVQLQWKAIRLRSANQSALPVENESFDVVISFNSLEHLHPLSEYLIEIKRILKKGGYLVGGIPCEGGLAWGLGRFLTTRRYVHRKYRINYDKIICWEHPNFADSIIQQLNQNFKQILLKIHPFSCLPMDFNLMTSFVFQKL